MRERPIIFSGPMVNAILEGKKTQTRRVIKTSLRTQRDGWGAFPTPRTGMLIYKDGAAWCDGLNPPASKPIAICPYGVPGDRLWVREIFCYKVDPITAQISHDEFWYRAMNPEVIKVDGDGGRKFNRDGSESSPWLPSIHMPRKLSRITLEITGIRVQRLQEISEEDAKAEGIDTLYSAWELKQLGYVAVDPETMGWKNYLWHGHFNDGDGNKLSDSWPYQYSNYANARGSFSSLWQLINGKKHPWDSNPFCWVIEFKRLAEGGD